MDAPLLLPPLLNITGTATVVVSVFGLLVAFKQSSFFFRSRNKTARSLAWKFLADALIFAVAILTGIGLTIEVSMNQWVIHSIMRIIALMFSVWASYRLYKRFEDINGKGDH